MAFHRFRFYIGVLLIVVCAFARPVTAANETLVRVLAYPFPPFLNEDMKTGLSVDLVNLLNDKQDNYIFDLSVQSPKRRYMGLAFGMYDMVLFEMAEWGWKESNIVFETTREIMSGGEVYVAARHDGRDQSYFKELKTKRIGAYFGYHYGFADFNADAAWLRKNFKIYLHHSHERIIDLVIRDKVDVGVVTYSFLKQHLKDRPELEDKLLISKRFDQVYRLPALIVKGSPISRAAFEAVLQDLKEDGSLNALFQRYGLQDQLTF